MTGNGRDERIEKLHEENLERAQTIGQRMTGNTDVDFAKLNELLLRGLEALHDHDYYDAQDLAEYGRVMDDFLNEADAARRIGDQPEEVREFWSEFMEEHL